jgi:hypothetical protein
MVPELRVTMSRAAITSLIEGYVAALTAASLAGDGRWLRALATYGRRYEVLADVTAPLKTPFAVRLIEDRPLNLEGSTSCQTIMLREARSVHVEARVDDHVVEFAPRRNPELLDAEGHAFVISSEFDGWRATADTIALYAHESRRGRPVALRITLRTSPLTRWTTGFLTALDFIAAGLVVVLPDGDYVARLALLILPTTLAVTVVLAREQSALSARLQARARRWLLGSLAVLWAMMLIAVGGLVGPTDSPKTSQTAVSTADQSK